MSDGTFMSWQEMQHLCLPPNSAMLVPPPPDQAELESLSAGVPGQRPAWLDDAFQDVPAAKLNEVELSAKPFDPEANRAAAERAEYGAPEVRLLANAITAGAILELLRADPAEEEPNNRQIPEDEEPKER